MGEPLLKTKTGDMKPTNAATALEPRQQPILKDYVAVPSVEKVSNPMNGLHVAGVGVGGIAGVAFGGGRYRCPGRYFAEMEMALTVGAILASWDLRLATEIEKNDVVGSEDTDDDDVPAPGDAAARLPPPNGRRLVGVKVPSRPCWVAVSIPKTER